MGSKPNWARGAGALGEALFRYGMSKERQKFLEEERRKREQAQMAYGDQIFERQKAMAEMGAALEQARYERDNPLVFPEGVQMPFGTNMPADIRMREAGSRLALQKAMAPAPVKPKSTVTVTGKYDKMPYEVTPLQALQYNNPDPEPDPEDSPEAIIVPTVLGDYVTDKEGLAALHNQLIDNGMAPGEDGIWSFKPEAPKEPKVQQKDTTTQADRLFGGIAYKTGTDSEGKFEVPFPRPGDLYEPDPGFPLQGEMASVYDDYVNMSGLPATSATAKKAMEDVLAQYDMGLADKISMAMRGEGLEGVHIDKKGRYRQERGGPWVKDPVLEAAEVFGRAIEAAVRDGVLEIEFNTITKAAKDAKIPMDRVFELWESPEARKMWQAYVTTKDM